MIMGSWGGNRWWREKERERDIKQGSKDKRIVLKGKGGKEG